LNRGGAIRRPLAPEKEGAMKCRALKLMASLACAIALSATVMGAAESADKPSSYMPVDIHESFATIMARMTAAKAEWSSGRPIF
jgi:hypothetical protein